MTDRLSHSLGFGRAYPLVDGSISACTGPFRRRGGHAQQQLYTVKRSGSGKELARVFTPGIGIALQILQYSCSLLPKPSHMLGRQIPMAFLTSLSRLASANGWEPTKGLPFLHQR